jgi:hypothetical protein
VALEAAELLAAKDRLAARDVATLLGNGVTLLEVLEKSGGGFVPSVFKSTTPIPSGVSKINLSPPACNCFDENTGSNFRPARTTE